MLDYSMYDISPDWVLNIIPQDMPSVKQIRDRGGDLSKASRYIDTWEKYVINPGYAGSDIREDADYEDWAEQAARLDSFLRMSGDRDVVITFGNVATDRYLRPRTVKNLYGTPQFGIETYDFTPHDTTGKHQRVVSRYAENSVLNSYLGRENCVVESVPDTLVRVITDYTDRYGTCVVKNIASDKDGLAMFTKGDNIRDKLMDDESLGWTVIRFEDMPDVWLVQQGIDMQYETRFCCIADSEGIIHPVTAAGCVVEMTPLQYTKGHSFIYRGVHASDYLRSRRGYFGRERTRDFICDGDRVRRLIDKAIEICSKLDSKTFSPYFTMDLAFNGDDIVLVETNDFLSSGLYACDLDYQIEKLLGCYEFPATMSILAESLSEKH